MLAREYTQIHRLDAPPAGPPASLAQRREALADVFRDVDFGTYDNLLVDWVADHFTDETARGLVSLVERARNAAILRSWADAKAPATAVGRAPVRDEDLVDEPVPDSRLQSLETEAGYGLPGPLHRRYR